MENGEIPTQKEYFKGEDQFDSIRKILSLNNHFTDGKYTQEDMTDFIKEMKKAGLTDEEAAQMAASKIADNKPKSRMYYKIGASREMAGGKKVDPKANMSDRLKVLMFAYNILFSQ